MEIGDQGPSSPELTAVLDTQAAGGIAIRGSAVRLLGYGLTVILSVVAIAALTRHLGARDFGRFSVVQSLVQIAAGLAEAGLLNLGIREYSVREGRERDAMLANLQGIRIALGVAGVGLALIFGLAAGYDGTMVAGIALTGAGVVLMAVQQTLGIPLSAGLRWTAVTGLDVLRQAAQTALFLVLVATGAGLLAFFVVPVPVGVLVLLATIPLVRRAASFRPRFDRDRWRELLRVVAPYAAATAVGTVYVYVAAVLMELVSSPNEVGWFAAAFRVFVVLGGIPALMVGTAFPILARAARDDRTRHAYATGRLLETTIIAGAWLALMTALLAELAIDVVAGSGFEPSVDVLRIQAIAVLASFLLAAVTNGLISLAHYRQLLVLSACALVVSAVLTLTLAPGLGAQGGGIANAAAESLAAVLGTVFLTRAVGVRFPWLTAAKVAVAVAAAGALALVPGLPDIATAALSTIVFAAVLLALRAIPDELLDAVPFLRR
jgi:O-antigen/teichoic acid export membrane protein